MGQRLAKPGTRRRLTQRGEWFEFEVIPREKKTDGMIFKPFGKWDYGYESDTVCYISWLHWVINTWGSFKIDYIEAAAILGIALYLQEHPEWWPEGHQAGTGASYVYNVQGGYCWYHYFVRGRKDWSTWLASWSTVATNIGATFEDFGLPSLDTTDQAYKQPVHHWAHMVGVSEGLSAAFLFEALRPKKGKSRGWLFLLIPFVTIGIIYMAEQERKKELSSIARLSDMGSDARR
jgi:hypothetical protein